MDVFQAIETRRSVKKFDPDFVMPQQDIDRLMELTILSPTAFNIQHWRFVLVRDRELRKQVRQVSWNQAQVTDASLLVVVCADQMAWSKSTERYWANAPQAARDFLLPAIDQYYRDNEPSQRDEAMRSCGMAAQTLMLAAKGMGYDSCPMDGFDFDAVAQLINLPEDHLISMFVAIGKPLEPARPRAGQLPVEQVVVTDRF